jgi:hypothetical protein
LVVGSPSVWPALLAREAHGKVGWVQSPTTRATELPAQTRGLSAAWAACACGLAYAAISLYWALGGSWLLATVGASLAGTSSAAVKFAVWAAVALKAIAAFLPLVAIGALRRPPQGWERWLRRLTWLEALILTAYGLVLTATGLLVQSGVIAPPGHVDHRALRWHAYLWDPWFLVWGLLVTTTLVQSRRRRE